MSSLKSGVVEFEDAFLRGDAEENAEFDLKGNGFIVASVIHVEVARDQVIETRDPYFDFRRQVRWTPGGARKPKRPDNVA